MVQATCESPTKDVAKACRELLGQKRLIIASNRGPIEYRSNGDGLLEASRGSGGVVAALSTMARFAPISWVACTMTAGDRQAAGAGPDACLLPADESGYDARLRFVVPTEEACQRHYNLFSNPFLWFLQHSLWDCLERPNLRDEVAHGWWRGYLPVNQAFACSILAELASPDAAPYVMLHDYHLYLAPLYVRARAPEAILTHFIHIPWPAPDAWQQLPAPMVDTICRGLLANDIVGFQTSASAHNFLMTCLSFFRAAEVEQIDWKGWAIRHRGRVTRVCHYPISVDVDHLRQRLASAAVRRYRERLLPLCGPHTIVRVDRLDPTKNVLAGFEAFDLLLKRHPELVGEVKVLAFLVPSRTEIPEYRRHADRVFGLIDKINHRYRIGGWQPIEVFYENNYDQALAGMSLYDVLLVNSLSDGMNLVAKEGAIANQRDGVLILSDRAGAHEELGREALSIDPTDIEGTALALWRALSMPAWEREVRAISLRQIVAERDIARWLGNQLADLKSIPQQASIWPHATPGGNGRSAMALPGAGRW